MDWIGRCGMCFGDFGIGDLERSVHAWKEGSKEALSGILVFLVVLEPE